MTPLMQILYEYTSRAELPRYLEHAEYGPAANRLERLEAQVLCVLGEEEEPFRRYLDAQEECSGMVLEAMFQAAFAAARELGC